MSSVRVRGGRLRQEIALRGWCEYDLARAAGISPTTLSTALRGRTVSAKTLSKIAQALVKAPVVPGLGDLLEVPTTDACQ